MAWLVGADLKVRAKCEKAGPNQEGRRQQGKRQPDFGARLIHGIP
jgi:hypothetical protein